jgi:hypothetical protein
MKFTSATVTLQSLSPYSQSFLHNSPRLEGESVGDHDARTWLSKAHISKNGTLLIPATAMHQAIVAAGKYSKKQIPGQGKATWTAKLKSGLMIAEDIDTGIPKGDIQSTTIQCDARGMTGAQKSTLVSRTFPIVPSWEATFDVWVLDPIITKDIFAEMVNIAGLFIGIGRWRPEMNGGMNGRFRLTKLSWQDNREFV